MLGEGGTPLSKLMAAIREFQAREDRSFDNQELRVVIDALKHELALSIAEADKAERKE
jgi:hypothetical protein